jgi:hypothetical protein
LTLKLSRLLSPLQLFVLLITIRVDLYYQQKVISHQWNDEQDYIWTYTSYRQSQSQRQAHDQNMADQPPRVCEILEVERDRYDVPLSKLKHYAILECAYKPCN